MVKKKFAMKTKRKKKKRIKNKWLKKEIIFIFTNLSVLE